MKKLLLILPAFLFTAAKAQFVPQWDSVGMGTSGTTPYAKAMAVNDSNTNIIYAGGDFTTTEKHVSNHIAQWTAQYTTSPMGTWSELGHGVNGEVTAITVFNHQVIAGGAFDSASGVAASYIARWDSVHGWDSIPGKLNGQVYVLVTKDTILYVGGSFTIANGITVNHIAQWNGKHWSAVGTGFDSTVFTLAVNNDTLFAGGAFKKSNSTTVNYVAKWNGSSWLNINGGMNNTVYALCGLNDSLYAGGAFTQAGSVTAKYIAQLNGNTWGSLVGGTNDTVKALSPAGVEEAVIIKPHWYEPYSAALVVGGSFTRAGSENADYCALYFFEGPTNGLVYGWNGILGLNGSVSALTNNAQGNYVGGVFDSINYNYFGFDSIPANNVAQFYFILGGGINELSDGNAVNVYPNPGHGVFNFSFKQNIYETTEIEVYNILGEVVYSTQFTTGNNFSMNIEKQPAGVYIYRIHDKSHGITGSGRLVVEN